MRQDAARRGRRGARRLALQALYQWLVTGGDPVELVSEFLTERAPAGIDRGYFGEIIVGAIAQVESLEAQLSRWLDRRLPELDPVERAVLLIGAWELLNRQELSRSIVINEAVQLARDFGASDGHRFVNGVLDRLADDCRIPKTPHE